MLRISLGLIGFGNVGQGLATILRDYSERLASDHAMRFDITAVADVAGAVLCSEPLPPSRLLDVMRDTGSICHYPTVGTPGMTGLETVRRAKADILVEATPTNIVDGEPGLSHIKAALERGMHVVTANKGPLVVAFAELRELARRQGRVLKYGPAAAAGLPTIDVGTQQLAGSVVNKIEGVLNGTTNYILTQMRDRGVSYGQALREAQEQGIAEADPTLDVEGYDTANKLLIIANSVMHGSLRLADIERQGITHLTTADLQGARASGQALKLVGTAWREDARLRAAVAPTLLAGSHPLARVDGSEKGVTFHSDLIGILTVTGGASGRIQTAGSVLCDLINLVHEARLT